MHLLRLFLLLLTAFTASAPSLTHAADISFNLHVVARDDAVTVTAHNVGRDPARSVLMTVELAGRRYSGEVIAELAPGVQRSQTFRVAYPKKPGTYPLLTSLNYLNDGVSLTLNNVGYFHYARTRELRAGAQVPGLTMGKKGTLRISHDPGYTFRLVLPNEIRVANVVEEGVRKDYELINTVPAFSSSYTIYGVLEDDNGAVYGSRIFQATLKTRKFVKSDARIPKSVYLTFACLGFLLSFFLYLRYLNRRFDEQNEAKLVAAVRWSFSVFVVSLLFFAFHAMSYFPDTFLNGAEQARAMAQGGFRKGFWIVVTTILRWFYFEGGNYNYFAHYVADPLYAYMLLGNYFVLYYFIKPDPERDKYWHLMQSVFSLIPHPGRMGLHWSTYSKVGALTLCVKMFYVPMLSSWFINNIFHQWNLTKSFQLTFIQVQAYIVALLIMADVAIFAFGYLVELPALKNQIKSVEPTILGWVVCLMCYPPFNSFAFRPFDVPLNHQWDAAGEFGQTVALTLIMLLWGIYTWASVALGPRASNLTNRGIVNWGPYRYIRHPAYASKVALWGVESYLLAQKHFYLVASLIVVYALRAWTEERHLSQDPDYLEYKKQVRWRFIPRLF